MQKIIKIFILIGICWTSESLGTSLKRVSSEIQRETPSLLHISGTPHQGLQPSTLVSPPPSLPSASHQPLNTVTVRTQSSPSPVVQQPISQEQQGGTPHFSPPHVQAPLISILGNPNDFSPEIQEIINRGELIVAMHSIDQPPFFMIDQQGELIGLDVEIAKKMAEILSVKLKFNREAKDFNEVINIVSEGKADIGISKLSYTLERAKKVLYSKSYIHLKKMFLINRLKMAQAKGKNGADTLEKLINNKDGTIGVIRNSSYEHFAEEIFPKATLVPLNSWGPGSLDLSVKGKVLSLFRDDLEILKLIRQSPDANFHVLPVTLKNQSDPIHIVLPWNKVHFLEWVNGFLSMFVSDITVENLLNQYDAYFKWVQHSSISNTSKSPA